MLHITSLISSNLSRSINKESLMVQLSESKTTNQQHQALSQAPSYLIVIP